MSTSLGGLAFCKGFSWLPEAASVNSDLLTFVVGEPGDCKASLKLYAVVLLLTPSPMTRSTTDRFVYTYEGEYE